MRGITPSFIGPNTQNNNKPTTRIYNNNKLRIGIVKKIHYPEDKANISKKYIEYDVLVMEQNTHGGFAPILYRNLLASEGFGGIGDFASFSYREQKKIKNEKKTKGINTEGQDGAIVIVLFLDGMANKGVIIGSLGHPDRKYIPKKNKHEFLFNFNGITFFIQDDGSMLLRFVGKTDHEGNPVNKDLGPTEIIINKEGGISISHKNAVLKIEKDGSFYLENKNTTTVNTEKDMSFNTKGAFSLQSEKAIKGQTKSDLILEASGTSNLKAQKVSIKGEGGVEVSGSKIDVKGDSSVTIKSTQIVLDGMVYLGGQGGSPAVTQSTMFIGTGNQGAPVVSQAIGPFSPKVFIA